MTNPITPPPKLVQEWINEEDGLTAGHIATRAAQWGADQELEACVAWLDGYEREGWAAQQLRSDRRPKPPSLKEQALRELGDAYDKDKIDDTTYDTIRAALEAQ